MQIKAEGTGHGKKPVKQVVAQATARQFHNFLSKADGRIIRNLIGLHV